MGPSGTEDFRDEVDGPCSIADKLGEAYCDFFCSTFCERSRHGVLQCPFCESTAAEDGKSDEPLQQPDGAVIQPVMHPEEHSARRDEDVMQMQAAHDWAANVCHLIQHSPGHGEALPEEGETIRLFYHRAPSEFSEALLHGPELRSAREELRTNGLDCTYSGAKVFVKPHQHVAALEALRANGIQPKTSHVIISDSLLPASEATIATIPSRRNVREKKGGKIILTTASSPSSSCAGASAHHPQAPAESDGRSSQAHASSGGGLGDAWDHALSTERTFLCTARSLRSPRAVAQSTTQAHTGPNPRRVIAALPREAPASRQSSSAFRLPYPKGCAQVGFRKLAFRSAQSMHFLLCAVIAPQTPLRTSVFSEAGCVT